MILKKRLIAIGAVIAMAAAAIYGSTLEMSGTGDGESRLSWFDRKETIYLWYADENLTDYLTGAAASFGEQEGVRVIPVMSSDSQYLEAINDASLNGTQVPDVFLLSNDSLEKAYLAGLAGEIQDERNICNETYFPNAALSAVSYHGKKIAYPLYFETSALIYNETYLEEWANQQATKDMEASMEEDAGEEAQDAEGDTQNTGEADSTEEETSMDGALSGDNQIVAPAEGTLEERTQSYLEQGIPTTVSGILHFADTFDAPENVEGVLEWDVSDIFYNYWIVGQYMIVGGDAGDDVENININNAETVQCLEVYKSLNQFFSIESDTINYDSVIQDFIDGKTVFTVGTTDVVKKLEDAKADGSFAYDYGVATMPNVSDSLQSRSLSVTNVAVVNGYSEHVALANRFAEYLAQNYCNHLYAQTGKVSANLNCNQDNGALQMFLTEYADSVPLPKMMETGNFWITLERLFAKVWNGNDVTAAVQELADQMSVQTGSSQIQEE